MPKPSVVNLSSVKVLGVLNSESVLLVIALVFMLSCKGLGFGQLAYGHEVKFLMLMTFL